MRIIRYLMIIMLAFIGSSCEKFLDKSPDMGLSDEDVYKDYNTIRGFLDVCYNKLDKYFGKDVQQNGTNFVGVFADEMAAIDNENAAATLHSGNWLRASKDDRYEIGVNGANPINRAYQSIRIANLVLANYTRVPNLTEQQTNELLGQAYFLRAWFYFQLLKRYGGMPKFDHPFMENGEEKIPRMTYHESHDWMMEDIEQAIFMLPDTWDGNNTGRPTKLAAMAFKSMAQLYDASPLMQNDLNTIENKGYDKERALIAAKSAKEVIDYIDSHNEEYRLMNWDEYKNIFYFAVPNFRQPEYIWYNRTSPMDTFKDHYKAMWLYSELAGGVMVAASCYNAPSQNMVDLYEKKGNDGNYYPITDERSGYNEQDPYKDRDPRFNNNILVPGEKWGKNSNNKDLFITTYVGGKAYEDMKILTPVNRKQQTGYLCKKYMWPGANKFTNEWAKYRTFSVYIRVSQIYLDFAEAAFEGTGSATEKVNGMSAEDAINIIRQRAGITALTSDRVNDLEKFREAIRNERAVELMFENNRWWDIRRWMILEETFKDTNPIKGIKATPINLPANVKPNQITNGFENMEFSYEIIELNTETRNYGLRNYWYPFPKSEVASSGGTLQQNPNW